MIALGFGFSSSAGSADILAAIDAALAGTKLRREDVGMLATALFKHDQQCLDEVSDAVGIAISYISREKLAGVESRLVTRSNASRERTGSDCLCEAAALAVLGEGSTLIMPRLVLGPVTCAIATGEPR